MIQRFSDWLTDEISKYTTIEESKKEIINYGLRIIAFEIILTIAFLIVGLILGFVLHMTIAVIVFGALRILAGGAHCKTRTKCFIMYNSIIWSTIYLSKIITFSVVSIIIILIFNIVIFLAEAPGDIAQKPIKKKTKRKRLKMASVLAAILIFSIAILLKNIDSVFTNILVISSVYSTFLLTPLGYLLCGCKRSNQKIY